MALWVLLSAFANMQTGDVFDQKSYDRLLATILEFAAGIEDFSDSAK